MKRIFYKLFIALALGSMIVSGCKKQLDITPRQSIESSGALTTREEINASIVGVYAILKGVRLYGKDLITHPEALADNGYATNKSGRLLNESNNVFGAHFTGSIWINAYQAINQINLTLEAIPNLQVVPAITPAEKANWEGQLYFLRALYYFDMARVYAYIPGAVVASQDRGGIPIVLKGIANKDSARKFFPPRAPIADVYSLIIEDLKKAETALLNNTLEKSLATKAAAQAMLARVYLYNKDYTNAKTWADACIALTGGTARLTDQSDYISNWRSADNKETIFHIKYASPGETIGVNESLQTSFTTLTAPGLTAVTGGFGDLVPSISLLNELGIVLLGPVVGGVQTFGNTNTIFTGSNAGIFSRTNDVRNLLYEPGTTGRGKSFVECTKYLGKNGAINLDNTPVVRASEMYLIRAEIQALSTSPVFNAANALADLKAIKSRRYVGYTGSAQETADNALPPAGLFEEIIRQRRLEFAFEGHRFFDLKRLGRDITKSAPSTATLLFTDARFLPPILQADVDGNPNLVQNFGY
jgi:starch-binding outer membrane protein, SusD/RagB family